MIQRIQSVYLLLAALFMGGLFLLPLGTSDVKDNQMLADGLYTITDSHFLLTATIGGVVFSLISIFLFRNRSLQIRVTYLIILQCLLIPAMAWMLLNVTSATSTGSLPISLKPGFFLPLLSLIVSVLAILAIRKDDRLVKSMDRLR